MGFNTMEAFSEVLQGRLGWPIEPNDDEIICVVVHIHRLTVAIREYVLCICGKRVMQENGNSTLSSANAVRADGCEIPHLYFGFQVGAVKVGLG